MKNMKRKSLSRYKLTKAAHESLEELIENYRNRILLEASNSASDIEGKIQHVAVQDIFDAANKVSLLPATEKRGRYERTALIGQIVGLFYIIFGFGYFLYKILDVASALDFLALIMGILGIVLMFAGSLLTNIRKAISLTQTSTPKESYVTNPSWALIQKWQKIELGLRNYASAKFGESEANRPLSSLIKQMYSTGLFNEQEQNDIRELLATRNKILHSNVEINKAKLARLSNAADKVIEKLGVQD